MVRRLHGSFSGLILALLSLSWNVLHSGHSHFFPPRPLTSLFYEHNYDLLKLLLISTTALPYHLLLVFEHSFDLILRNISDRFGTFLVFSILDTWRLLTSTIHLIFFKKYTNKIIDGYHRQLTKVTKKTAFSTGEAVKENLLFCDKGSFKNGLPVKVGKNVYPS
jgi:hypothetical protein